jgi:hypothetical protein
MDAPMISPWRSPLATAPPAAKSRRRTGFIWCGWSIGEKLPLAALESVRDTLSSELGRKVRRLKGVYMALDSFGVARYGGRGQIFARLRSHRDKHRDELVYFSFYIIEAKRHEREIETAIIRAAESQMFINKRKVRIGIKPGNVTDYEAGTLFFERQSNRGRRKKMARSRAKRRATES